MRRRTANKGKTSHTGTSLPSLKFLAKHRIKKKSDFAKLQRAGRRTHATHFLLVIAPNSLETSRLGVAVTKKVEPSAVRRNKIRRRLKEIFRHVRSSLSGAFDILIIARNNAPRCDFQQTKQEILGALKRAGCLRQE